MEKAWAALTGAVDEERHAAVAAKLRQQTIDAAAWRDKCLGYFAQFSKQPTTPAAVPADIPVARTDQNSVTRTRNSSRRRSGVASTSISPATRSRGAGEQPTTRTC